MPIADGPRSAAGSMTAGSYGTMALDLYESVPALTYPLSLQTYGKMRFDPQIQAVTGAYTYPLRSATWSVNPVGCRDEVVQLIADAWGLPIAGTDDPPGPARRRGIDWDDHLRLALLHLTFGHSPFAIAGEVTGNPMRWKLTELSERLPQTISDIEVNDNGSLKQITQVGTRQPILAKDLLWYAHNREGSAWQGQSMLRSAYGPWLLKHEMWRVLAQSSRRFGMGVPTVKAPPGGTPADVTAAATIASGYRAGDQSGIGLPDGYQFDLTGLTGSVPDTLGFTRYLDQQIAQSVLASVLNLDESSNGSRALGETMIGLLELSWKAVAREISGTATKFNVRMVDWNFGEDEPVPAILCSDISRPEITSEAIAALVTCGALSPELSLENDLRVRYQLPVIKQRPAPVAVAPTAPPQAPDPNPAPADPEPAVDPVPA